MLRRLGARYAEGISVGNEMSCVLRAGGSEFQIDAWLESSTLKPSAIFRRGELKSSRSRKTNEQSAINISVSGASSDDLNGQIQDAIDFLRRNKDEVSKLHGWPGVEIMILDFGIRERDSAIQNDRFPSELLLLMGDLGIELEVSRYAKVAESV